MTDPSSIIASVDEPPTSPRGASSSALSNSIRKIFSPSPKNPAPSAPSPPRRRLISRLCACLAPSPPSSAPSPTIADLRAQLADLEPSYSPETPLLPPSASPLPCLVLDLDETLVHSSFTRIPDADYEIPLDMGGETHTVFVKKRPGVDAFLATASHTWELVIFTASLSLYADPVMAALDPRGLCASRLYREHCALIGGCYVKDIAALGRDLKRTLIVDNSPLSYALQPENAVPIEAFFSDRDDRELEKTLALLHKAAAMDDVRGCWQAHQDAIDADDTKL